MEFIFSQLLIDSIELKGKSSLVHMNSFFYQNFPITIQHSIINNCSAVLGGMLHLTHGSNKFLLNNVTMTQNTG